MSNVFDVANYILEKKGSITTMKLQKLVYYSQAWSLVWDEEPLFEEEFEAWANGPVCRELFNKHKNLFRIEKNYFDDYKSDTELNETQKETIDAVLDHYGDKEPYWLSELTHKEKPWKEARNLCDDGEYCNNIITKQSMQEYYMGL